MIRPVGLAPIIAQAAAGFAALGVLDDATPLLDELGWDGRIAPGDEPATLASAYERELASSVRHTRGVHYTPAPVAGKLASLALASSGLASLGLESLGLASSGLASSGLASSGLASSHTDRSAAPLRVGDPACGAGAFLVATAEALQARGAPVGRIVSEQLFGADVDATAVALTRLEIARWSAQVTGRVHVVPEAHLVVGDSLVDPDAGSWIGRGGEMDVVVGNPPFGSQLRGGTVRDRARQERLARELGIGALGYADTAALFLLRAIDLVRTGGRVALILPSSLAATRGSEAIRRAVGRRTSVTDVWVGGVDVGFDAAVSVWAPVFAKTEPAAGPVPIRRFHGSDVRPLDTVQTTLDASSWAPLLAPEPRSGPRSLGPSAVRGPSGTIASVAAVTAGFRRHFYGLVPHVRDDRSGSEQAPVLVTTGVIDPMHHRVDAPVRFAGRDFDRPVIDVAALAADEPAIAAWVRSLLVPKVLIASQGRVLEAIVDSRGTLIPSTPVIAVVPTGAAGLTVWHLAAAVSSPLASLHLRDVAAGTGLDGRGSRVTARFVRELALPADRDGWDAAADAARRATRASSIADRATWADELDRLGAALLGLSATVDTPQREEREAFTWWIGERPRWRGARLLSR